MGVKGQDLLAATDTQLIDLGIKSSIHLNRIRASIRQLVEHQEKIDKETALIDEQRKNEKPYFDLLASFENSKTRQEKYDLPYIFTLWKPIDLFYYLNSNVFDPDLKNMFCKPIAMQRLGGQGLLGLINKGEKVSFSTCTVTHIF